MAKIIRKLTRLITPAIFLSFPVAVWAQEGTQIVPNTLININNIVAVVRAIIRFILVVAFVIAFIMLLVGGIRWILAGGDEKAVAGARNTITAALIGLVVVLVAFAIIRLVEIFFGVNIISNGVIIPKVTDQP